MTKKLSNSDLMKIAFEELRKCEGFPKIGAVIAKNGMILSKGFRGEVSSQHAERVAIEKIDEDQLTKATLYTTLEPCVEIYERQLTSCSDLIIASGITDVVIGVLDQWNAGIYSKGVEKLQENGINVTYFSKRLKEAIKQETFRDDSVLVGSVKRRVPVIHSGIDLTVQFSETDDRTLNIRWSNLQQIHGLVYLYAGRDEVTVAAGAKSFRAIADPMIFEFPSHCQKMSEGMISVVKPTAATFCVLVELLEIHQSDIVFRIQIRNIR